MNKKPLLICLAIVLCTVLAAYFIRESKQPPSAVDDTSSSEHSSTAHHSHSHTEDGNHRRTKAQTRHWQRKSRPFEVVQSSDRFEWTAEDGKSDEVIEILANNDRMADFLKKRNAMIKRRQLVYVDPQFSADMKSAFNQEGSDIVVPGFDGEEFKVQLTPEKTFGDSDELSGSFRGNIPDIEGSRIVGGSDKDTWAIGIYLPGRQYQIQSRENGEFIVSEIDLHAAAHDHDHDHHHRSVDDVGTALNP